MTDLIFLIPPTHTRSTYFTEMGLGTPVCRLCGRYLAILGRLIRVTVPAVIVAPTALIGSLIRSSNLPHGLQRGVRGKTAHTIEV